MRRGIGADVRARWVMALGALIGAAVLGGSPAVAAGRDTTPPVVDSVSSVMFPPAEGPDPSTGRQGEPGDFVIRVGDVGAGLRRVQWQLNTPMGVAGVPARGRFSGWRSLDGAPSASVTVTVTPPQWGTNTLYVRVVDLGGRRSQDFQYRFYAQSRPLPTADPHGDVTGDGIPDVLTADAAGDLRVYPGTAGGDLAAPFVGALRGSAPGDGGWGDTRWAHRGSPFGNSVDDLWVISPGGGMYVYRNDGLGDFVSNAATVVPRRSCSTCTGYASSWSRVSSFVVVEHAAGSEQPSLITLEDGKVWRFPLLFGSFYTSVVAVPLSLPDPAHADLVSPGDVTGDGIGDLWVRDRVSGRLTQFAGTATGFETEGTVLAWSGFDAVSHPVVTSVGDLSGDGVPDLLTTSPLGGLQIRSATSLHTPSWISPQPFVAKAVTVEGQLAHP